MLIRVLLRLFCAHVKPFKVTIEVPTDWRRSRPSITIARERWGAAELMITRPDGSYVLLD